MQGVLRKNVVFALLLAAACLLQTGCPDSGAKDETKFTIGMSQCNLGEPYRVQMDEDIRQAAKAYPEIKVVFKDAERDASRQRSQVEEMISAKYDLIIISPLEAAPLTAPVAKAIDAGIPVIVLDRAVNGDKYTCFIGADNRVIGEEAGRWIKETLSGKGKIVELRGQVTSVPGIDRHEGFLKGIEGSDLEVIFEADMEWLEDKAKKEMESALARYKEIDLVYAHNDPAAHGAYLAAKAAGREGEMKFVGVDALPQEGQMYVKQGLLDATFLYPTGGKEAVETAMKILKGEEVEKKIVLPTQIFTKEK
jgi:ABC-type sugar transport system, periplasmic component